jgi:hypothetical protein
LPGDRQRAADLDPGRGVPIFVLRIKRLLADLDAGAGRGRARVEVGDFRTLSGSAKERFRDPFLQSFTNDVDLVGAEPS